MCLCLDWISINGVAGIARVERFKSCNVFFLMGYLIWKAILYKLVQNGFPYLGGRGSSFLYRVL